MPETRLDKDKNMMKDIVSSTIQNLMENQDFVDVLRIQVNIVVQDAVDKVVNDFMQRSNERISALEKSNDILLVENAKVKARIEHLEQYSRRNCIRIFGIQEKHNENLDEEVLKLFNNYLKQNIQLANIDRVHRIGKRSTQMSASSDSSSSRPRPVIVKFVSYRNRRAVWQDKKKLKGTGIVIREDLAPTRLELWKKAVEKYNYRNVWTSDGTIFIKYNDKNHAVSTTADLEAIPDRS